MDPSTGEALSSEKFEEQDAGRRARSWFRFVHTGEYYGLVGQAIAAVASFAACMLVWTGFVLSWRRLTAWLTSRKLRMMASELKVIHRAGRRRVVSFFPLGQFNFHFGIPCCPLSVIPDFATHRAALTRRKC
jgi:uncharacterized iron-regulated membrane protein